MDIDVASLDHALTTTRAVRLRLDLARPVDDQTIYDCIDIAEQAPSGGNQGSRRWIVVRDQRVEDRLAELYMATGGEFMIGARDRHAGIVIPTIIGVHDGSGRPGFFDSVIQSVWSFCVALRARGLGTAWTTAILAERDALGELSGVPDGTTQIAMIPVAYTVGTDFRPARRFPARGRADG